MKIAFINSNETFMNKDIPKDNIYYCCDDNNSALKYINFIINTTIEYDYYIFVNEHTVLNIENLNKFLLSVNIIFENKDLYIGYTEDYLPVAKYMNFHEKLNSHYEEGKFKTGLCLSSNEGFILSKKLYNRIKEFLQINSYDKIITFSKDQDDYNGDVLIGRLCSLVPTLTTIYNPLFYTKSQENKILSDDWISYHNNN